MPTFQETEAVLRTLSKIRKIEGSLIEELAQPVTVEDPLESLIKALKSDWILSVQGYFINHRPSSPYAQLDDEYKVQDLIFCLASSLVPDLHFENPRQKTTGALTSTRVDFSSQSRKMLLEVKLATDTHRAKKIESEMSEDIVKYGKRKLFDTLIFFIFCHKYTFPNRSQFETGFTGVQEIDGHRFQIICIVKP